MVERLKKYFPLLIFLPFIFWFFSLSSSLYFTQDDFFHLRMSGVEQPRDFFNFFSFNNQYGYTFYRPLTTQVYLFILSSLFGLNPFIFHLAALVVFLLNLVLIFSLVRKITSNQKLGIMASFLYGINASNIGSLSYISAFQEIGVAFFFFLTFWLFLKKSKWATVTFILALLSKETAIVLPLLLTVYEFFLGTGKWKKILSLWVVLGIYGFLRFSSGLPDASVYTPTNSFRKIANGYFWYLLWGIGLPEMLIDFVGPFLKINPKLFLWYGKEFRVIFIALALLLSLIPIGVLKLKKEERKTGIFFLCWFLIGLLPVIFWPWHKYSFYLTIPLLGLAGLSSLLLINLPRVLQIVGVFSLLTVSLVTIALAPRTYWVITRAKIAQNLVKDLKNQYPQLPKGASVYFKNDPLYPIINPLWGNSSAQASYILSGNNAVQVLYKDNSLRVYYEDLKKPDPNLKEIYPIVARIIQ